MADTDNRPRPYNLANADDRARLLRETLGYARVSLHHGTDTKGRRYAYDALKAALDAGGVLELSVDAEMAVDTGKHARK